MKIAVVSGSRADLGMLTSVYEALRVHFADVRLTKHDDHWKADALPDLVVLLGDRHEILRVALSAHLHRIPIAHICGGDVTEGSYDDAMRDCISRMASIHFVTSTSAMARLAHMGCKNVHLVGSPGIDVIREGSWRRESPYPKPYVVVSYQSETLDPVDDIRNFAQCVHHAAGRFAVFMRPNLDSGVDAINRLIDAAEAPKAIIEYLPHPQFLNLLAHCEEFIGNSSAMLYEAPELGIKTKMVGKRQKGRTIPWGDGHAAERIAKILRYT